MLRDYRVATKAVTAPRQPKRAVEVLKQAQVQAAVQPTGASGELLRLQRQAGNRGVSRLLQSARTKRAQREPDTVDVDLVVPTPEEAKTHRELGVELPTASAKASDPRLHSDYLDRRVTAVGFGIYVGGYYLYVGGLDVPVFLPNALVAPHIAKVTNFDNVIYPSRDEAMKAVSTAQSTAKRGVPMTYFRGPGGLVVPLYVTPATAPITYETMVGAQRELGRQVSRELTVLAVSIVGGMLIKAGIRLVAGVAGRAGKPRGGASQPSQDQTSLPANKASKAGGGKAKGKQASEPGSGPPYLMPEGFKVGKVLVPKAPTPQVLGQEIEQPIRNLVAKHYGFKLPSKAPSATGPDIVVSATKRAQVGFDVADVKPLNVEGVKKFWEQLDNWRDYGWAGGPKSFKGKAALFGYDGQGNVYLYGIFEM